MRFSVNQIKVSVCQHLVQCPFAGRLQSIDRIEAEHLLLDIRRQQGQIEELGDAGAGSVRAWRMRGRSACRSASS